MNLQQYLNECYQKLPIWLNIQRKGHSKCSKWQTCVLLHKNNPLLQSTNDLWLHKGQEVWGNHNPPPPTTSPIKNRRLFLLHLNPGYKSNIKRTLNPNNIYNKHVVAQFTTANEWLITVSNIPDVVLIMPTATTILTMKSSA